MYVKARMLYLFACLFFFSPLPVGDPGSGLGGHGAEEHRGVLPAVEGDWLRGQTGAAVGAANS